MNFGSLQDNDFQNYLNWTEWTRETARILSMQTKMKWRARDVEMAVYASQKKGIELEPISTTQLQLVSSEKLSQNPDITNNKNQKIVIERSIYDPVTQKFVISQERPLVNIQDWIQRKDPCSYWLILCVHNNTDTVIDEWGIEMESSSSLKILECYIEGVEHTPTLNELHPLPWQSQWIVGVPHHFGITLPRNGSRRLYFKLSSEACGVSHSIKGKLIVPDGIEISIKEKSFNHSCDVATLNIAIMKNPATAEKYAKHFFTINYSQDIAVKLLRAFKIVQEINQSCAIHNYIATLDKLHQLVGALESTNGNPAIIDQVKNTIWAIEQLGDGEESSIRVQRLCQNIVDLWINEVIYKSGRI